MAKLVGFEQFKRCNPMTDKFELRAFHHVEFYVDDASTAAARFASALGLHLVARSDLSTGNARFSSQVLGSGSVRFVFTAPTCSSDELDDAHPSVTASPRRMREYTATHGLAVYAVCVEVKDARDAFEAAVAHGARAATPPRAAPGNGCVVSEVILHPHGDAVLRFVSGVPDGGFLPGYTSTGADASAGAYGFTRLDHVVSNVAALLPAVDYLAGATGMHEFAEFTSADVGTALSGLNSMVLASNNERVLLPINEPTDSGGARKSQIQTFLDLHGGPGVQHIAIKTDAIFETIRAMRAAHEHGCGFELMERPRASYYEKLRARLGDDALSAEQAAACAELGILVDRDDQGVLLQVFTKPVGDRATLFLEVIQRIGCDEGGAAEQKGGCGGFGKGNFHELFRAIEEYETKAGLNVRTVPSTGA